jgi:hypothetical protein
MGKGEEFNSTSSTTDRINFEEILTPTCRSSTSLAKIESHDIIEEGDKKGLMGMVGNRKI